MSNFSAIFRLVASATGFNSTINSAKQSMAGIGSKLGDGLKGQIGKIFSVSGAFTMLKGTMEEVLNRAKQYNNLGQRMGMSAVEVQKLDKAAEQAGINVSSLGRGMQLVQKNSQEALGGATTKAKMLKSELGASDEQLKKMSAGGIEGMATLAGLMENLRSDADRDAVGVAILGEKWFELKQFILQGEEAVRKSEGSQTKWEKDTQDSLTRMQKAWANMWNDISVLAAELLDSFEWLVGLARFFGNFVLGIIRIIVVALQQGFTAVQVVINLVLGAIQKIADFFQGTNEADAFFKAAGKGVDEVVTRNENTLEDLKKDAEGMGKGMKQFAGHETGEEVKTRILKNDSDDTRTIQERTAYKEALESEKEKQLATDLSNAKEEEKVDILKKQLDLMKEQERLLKEKHPTRYKETKEYLELMEKVAAQERKIKKQADEDQKNRYENEVMLEEHSNARRLARMRAMGAKEEIIFEETLNQQREQVIRIRQELMDLAASKGSEAEMNKKRKELLDSIAKTEDLIFEQQKKDKEAAAGTVIASSLQAIGGGGAYAVTSGPAKQLIEAKKANELLQRLVTLAEESGVGKPARGVYIRKY